MSGTSPLYAPQASPRLYQQSGAESEAADPTMWHPALEYSQPLSMANQNYNWAIKSEDTGSLETFHQYVPHSPVDIAQPAPTRHIDTRYLESQSVSRSPEMTHPSASNHPMYHHRQQVVSWPAQSDYEYEYISYPGIHVEAAVAPGYYYSPPSTAYYNGDAYSVYSPYAHMQPSACPPSSYAQPYPTALYGCPIDSPPAIRRNSYVPYTPISSNPSSGTTSPQFEPLDPQYDYEHINSAEGTEALLTPITPTILHHPRMPTTLLLGQSGMTSEPVTMYPYHQQEPSTPFQQHQVLHEANFQAPASYVPLSPVSPVLEHPLAANQVVPDATTPTTAAPHSTTFVAESGHQEEEEEDALVLLEPGVDISAELAQSQVQAAERLKKLRERRHVVACTFCRGRKIACHSPIQPASTETDDGIPSGVAQASSSSSHPRDDEYKPTTASSSTRRPVLAPGVPRPACENCLRRGRECVYPPRVPRVPRRRRKTATAAPAVVGHQHLPPRYPVLSINTHFLH